MIDAGVMTVREVADYLKLEKRTIYRLAASGGLPAFKVGGSWRFRKGVVDRWTEYGRAGPPGEKDSAEKMTVPTIFETCRPREDALDGAVAEAGFAADPARVIASWGD